jgi:uncharacterized protein (UPF0303 family)
MAEHEKVPRTHYAEFGGAVSLFIIEEYVYQRLFIAATQYC